jgi:hypothetical protein
VRPHAPETKQRVQELRALGESYLSISRTLGVPVNTVRGWCDPVYAEKKLAAARAWKAKQSGRCLECGGPTKLNGRGQRFSDRCKWCAQGKTPPPAPDTRRCVPVRLVDIDLEARLAGAREANRWEKGEWEKQEILLAALSPSDHVYWVSESALPILEQVAA